MSRQGIPDYLCTFRKPGKNEQPVTGEFETYRGDTEAFDKRENKGNLSIDIWQRYASPIWTDINQTNTLNARMGRDGNDERHVCPLQLDVISRCLQLWSNPGDVVLSPFAGIGSEGVGALREGRKFVGVELKQSYFDAAVKFLTQQESEDSIPTLFD
jgi:DNA modification methylase